ncbi:RYR3 protein, partial [Eubucco bourcierii]|nr:RYR3 protein [Eubucco bourcierii]
TLKELISQTMVRWSQEDQIQDPELVRIMYTLLRRQYDSIGELLQALRKAYTISAASVKDTINLLAALGQIRSLLSVRMGKEEELLMINGLGYGIAIIVLQKVLNTPSSLSLSSQQSCSSPWIIFVASSGLTPPALCPFSAGDTCTGGRIGESPLLPCCPHSSGCSPAHSCLLGCTRALLAPEELPSTQQPQDFFSRAALNPHCTQPGFVVTYLAGCGLQSCPVLLAKGYPDIGWNPIEGERYLSFLRFAVFVNSE